MRTDSDEFRPGRVAEGEDDRSAKRALRYLRLCTGGRLAAMLKVPPAVPRKRNAEDVEGSGVWGLGSGVWGLEEWRSGGVEEWRSGGVEEPLCGGA